MKLHTVSIAVLFATALTIAGEANAQKAPQSGEIKIGQSMPYSGPAAVWGIFGKAASAYFAKVNDEGGINGRKINFLSYDDAYSAPKALEQTRKLVEQDNVLAIFATGGTAVNTAIQRYLNDRKVPQLFITAGGGRFADPKTYPWTIGWQPTFEMEARIYTRHVLKDKPEAKIGVLHQNDDFGKEFLNGIQEVVKGSKAKIVSIQTYEPTDPTVDTQVIALKSAGADVFFNVTTPKFTVQAIKKAAEIGWKPTQFIYTGAASVTQVFTPAGLDASSGILTGAFLRDPGDPAQHQTKEYKDYLAWQKKYLAEGRPDDLFVVFSYSMAQTMEHVLRKAGNDLSRENLLKLATSIQGLKLPMLLPGIEINTSKTDYRPIDSMRMQRFNGKNWEIFGDVIKG